MTNDSRLFPPLEQWEAKGYKPDVFGRWIGQTGGRTAGLSRRMIDHFDPVCSKDRISGKGRTAGTWRRSRFDANEHRAPVLDVWRASETTVSIIGVEVAFMDITSRTNTRTMIALNA